MQSNEPSKTTGNVISRGLGGFQWVLLFIVALLLPVVGQLWNIQIRPAAPPLELTGENLFENGTFDNEDGWIAVDNIDTRIEDGSLFARRTSRSGASIVEQTQDVSIPANTPFQLNAQLRNPSSISIQVVLRLKDVDSPATVFCRFWLPPRTLSETYVIRGQAPIDIDTTEFQMMVLSTPNITRFPVVVDTFQLQTVTEPHGDAPTCEVIGFPRRIDISFAHVGIILLLGATIARFGVDQTYWQQFRSGATQTIRQGGFWWLALIVWGLAVAWWAIIPIYATYYTVLLLLEVLLAIVIALQIRRGGFVLVASILLAAALPHAIIAIIQQINGGTIGLGAFGERAFNPADPYGFGPQDFRAYALAWHPNILGGFLSVTLMSSVVLLIHLRGKIWQMALVVVGMLIIASGLLATSSRAAIVIPPAAMALVLVWVFRRQGRVFWQAAIGLAVLGSAFIGVLALTPIGQPVIERFTELGFSRAGFINRVFFEFETTWDVFLDHRFTGVGTSNISHGLLQQPEGVARIPAHNVYMVILAELGILGGVLYALGLWHPVRWLRNPNITLRLMIAVVVGLALVILLDYYFWSRLALRPFTLWLLGMVWGLRLIHNTQSPEVAASN